MEQPALRMNIINGLQKLHCNSLTYIDPATEKLLTLFREALTRKCHPTLKKTPKKRKPPDKISFIIRGLG